MRGITAVIALTASFGLAGFAQRAPSNQAQSTLTPQDLQAAMKTIGSRYPAMLKKLQSNDASGAADDGKELATQFGNVEKFWAQHNKPDAVKLAQDARGNASTAAGAAAGGDTAKALTAAQNMGGACKQCHGLYREGDATTGFRIKAGAI